MNRYPRKLTGHAAAAGTREAPASIHRPARRAQRPDVPTDAGRANSTGPNATCADRRGFPSVIAVRHASEASILDRDIDAGFAEACTKVERIAELRLKDMLPL